MAKMPFPKPATTEPPLSGALTVPPEALALLTADERPRPHHSPDFPAQRMTTPLTWGDLVVSADVREQLQAIRTRLGHQDEILPDAHLRRPRQPGYRALFDGPPGTGKTLAAQLLGQATGHEVYRVDLSLVVSRYTGETEQNLARVFDTAERRRWILFFDEADALVGKRTTATASNDRPGNQEIASLRHRMEDFPGVIILASHLEGTRDKAVARQFQAMVHFPLPGPAERLQLWQQAFARTISVSDNVDFAALAENYSVTGGAITNVLRYCVLRLSLQQKQTVSTDDIMEGLQRELARAGKTI